MVERREWRGGWEGGIQLFHFHLESLEREITGRFNPKQTNSPAIMFFGTPFF